MMVIALLAINLKTLATKKRKILWRGLDDSGEETTKVIAFNSAFVSYNFYFSFVFPPLSSHAHSYAIICTKSKDIYRVSNYQLHGLSYDLELDLLKLL